MSRFCNCDLYCGGFDEKCPNCGNINIEDGVSILSDRDREINHLYLDGNNALAILEASVKKRNVSSS